MKKILSLILVTLLMVMLCITTVYAAEDGTQDKIEESVAVHIEFTIENSYGSKISIEAVNDTTPMPEQTDYTNVESGSFSITYTEPLTYLYKIHQIAGENEKVTYDETSYIVMVTVLRNEEDDTILEATVTISRDKDNEKLDSIEFKNTIETNTDKPDPPQTGDNSNVTFWITLMCISTLGIASTFAASRFSKN